MKQHLGIWSQDQRHRAVDFEHYLGTAPESNHKIVIDRAARRLEFGTVFETGYPSECELLARPARTASDMH